MGYLICDKCAGYYELQEGESPEDFSQCQCGGHLQYVDEIRNPNGLHVYKNQLIVGNNSDNCLKSVNLIDKRIGIIVKLGPGIIDGVKSDKDGNYLVSHWQGKLYRVTQEGKITKLLDTTAPEINEADFENNNHLYTNPVNRKSGTGNNNPVCRSYGFRNCCWLFDDRNL